MNPVVWLVGLAALAAAALSTLRTNAGALQTAGQGLSNSLGDNTSPIDSSGGVPSIEFPGTSGAGVATSSASDPVLSAIAAAVSGRSPTTATNYGAGVFPGTTSATSSGPLPGTTVGSLPGLPSDIVGQPTLGGAVNLGGGIRGGPGVSPYSFQP